jgi:phospholipase C
VDGKKRKEFERMNAMNFSRTLIALAAQLALGGLAHAAEPAAADALTAALRGQVQNIVVIYAENRAFDNLFGRFPGADGLRTVLDANGKPTAAYMPQRTATAACCRPCRRSGAA